MRFTQEPDTDPRSRAPRPTAPARNNPDALQTGKHRAASTPGLGKELPASPRPDSTASWRRQPGGINTAGRYSRGVLRKSKHGDRSRPGGRMIAEGVSGTVEAVPHAEGGGGDRSLDKC